MFTMASTILLASESEAPVFSLIKCINEIV